MEENINIREAKKEDCESIFNLICELAQFEKLEQEVKGSADELALTLFGEKNHAECLVAEVRKQIVGFALYFHNYSTFLTRSGIYLEDLFVRPEMRSQGIGRKLLKELSKIARSRNCGRLEWSVLDWNKRAIDFYLSIGAKAQNEWTVYRLNEKAIHSFIES